MSPLTAGSVYSDFATTVVGSSTGDRLAVVEHHFTGMLSTRYLSVGHVLGFDFALFVRHPDHEDVHRIGEAGVGHSCDRGRRSRTCRQP